MGALDLKANSGCIKMSNKPCWMRFLSHGSGLSLYTCMTSCYINTLFQEYCEQGLGVSNCHQFAATTGWGPGWPAFCWPPTWLLPGSGHSLRTLMIRWVSLRTLMKRWTSLGTRMIRWTSLLFIFLWGQSELKKRIKIWIFLDERLSFPSARA